MKRIKRKKFSIAFWIASAFLALIVLMAVVPGLFTPYDPIGQDMTALMQKPSSAHWFGTDNLGRDIFSRVVYSARLDLEIGIFAMLVPAVVGTMVGLLSGYYGGKVDAIIMRILDIFTAFPLMVLVIAIVAILGSGIKNLFIAIWLVGWREYAKLVRGETLVAKNSEYVAAARTLGFSNARIMLRHVLPNVINGAFVYAISDIMLCMLMGASLSFLGLGVPAPTPEWGAIIADGKLFITTAPWIVVFPGIMLALTGISISIIGEQVSAVLQKTTS
ncbi:MAG: ABC transporter permease [Lachnospiraceae bacterium]|nr:ABC transporter permease [Lachnospiraceae bacterium]